MPKKSICNNLVSGTLDEKYWIIHKLSLSDSGKCFVFGELNEKDTIVTPLGYAKINIKADEKDTIKTISDSNGEFNLLTIEGRNRIQMDYYINTYKLDTTIDLERGAIVKLIIEVDKSNANKIKMIVNQYPYKILDLFYKPKE
jgi:hypothetical protein